MPADPASRIAFRCRRTRVTVEPGRASSFTSIGVGPARLIRWRTACISASAFSPNRKVNPFQRFAQMRERTFLFGECRGWVRRLLVVHSQPGTAAVHKGRSSPAWPRFNAGYEGSAGMWMRKWQRVTSSLVKPPSVPGPKTSAAVCRRQHAEETRHHFFRHGDRQTAKDAVRPAPRCRPRSRNPRRRRPGSGTMRQHSRMLSPCVETCRALRRRDRPRCDENKVGETHIPHGPRSRPEIGGDLRTHQHHTTIDEIDHRWISVSPARVPFP